MPFFLQKLSLKRLKDCPRKEVAGALSTASCTQDIDIRGVQIQRVGKDCEEVTRKGFAGEGPYRQKEESGLVGGSRWSTPSWGGGPQGVLRSEEFVCSS